MSDQIVLSGTENSDNTSQSVLHLPDGRAEQYIARRVCARCYGDLTQRPVQGEWGMWEITCPSCGEAWNAATVSRAYAERLGQEALAQLADVKHNLPDLFPNPHRGKSEAQILSELGY